MAKVIVQNLTEGEGAQVVTVPLPDGGDVRVGQTRTYEGISTAVLERGAAELFALRDEGKISISVLPDDNESDFGGRTYVREFVLTATDGEDSDFTDGDTAQAFTDTYVFPDNAIQAGYSDQTSTAFVNPTTLVADIGYNGDGEGDLLSDGGSIKAAATRFGSGANATPNARRAIGGKQIKVSATSGDINMSAITAGRLKVRVYFQLF